MSEIRRQRDPGVVAWAHGVAPDGLFVSVLTIGEIRKGVELLRARDPHQAEPFDSWLADVQRRFSKRILPVTAAVAEQWGRLNAARPRTTVDSLIAATAHVHALTVATGNTRDFADSGVPVINPFTG